MNKARERVLRDVAAERDSHARRGYDTGHDARHNVDHLVRLAERYARRENDEDPGYFSRKNLIKAASLLVAAIERLDTGEDNRR